MTYYNKMDHLMRDEQKEELKVSLKAGHSILVVGGVGTGKTQMANWLLNQVSEDEKVVVVETNGVIKRGDNIEILTTTHLPREEKGKRIKEALRKRVDIFVVDEIREGKDVEMVQELQKQEKTVIATMHGNGESYGVRLGSLFALEIGGLVPEDMSNMFDRVVLLEMLDADGRRRVRFLK